MVLKLLLLLIRKCKRVMKTKKKVTMRRRRMRAMTIRLSSERLMIQ